MRSTTAHHMDAGIGRPSQACEAMEMGAAAIMANTALATAGDPPLMAFRFKKLSKPDDRHIWQAWASVLTKRIRIRSAHRISAQLGAMGKWKTVFCRFLLLFPRTLEKKSTGWKPIRPAERTIWNICRAWSRSNPMCATGDAQMKSYITTSYTKRMLGRWSMRRVPSRTLRHCFPRRRNRF